MNTLPYRAKTATGDSFDIEFPLHADTESAMRVSQLIDTLLETLTRELAVLGVSSNGDVLQALAMTTAVRARMIHAPSDVTAGIATDLLKTALQAAAASTRDGPPAGHA